VKVIIPARKSEANNEREADPAHSAPVQGSDSGRAQGETAGKEDKNQVSVAGQEDQMREKRENFDEYFLR
jgi:hypothetical protein